MPFNGYPNRTTFALSLYGFIDKWIDFYTDDINDCNSKNNVNKYLKKISLDSVSDFIKNNNKYQDSIKEFIKKDFTKFYNIYKYPSIIRTSINTEPIN